MNSDRTVLMATHFSACWNREKYVLCNLEIVINLIDQVIEHQVLNRLPVIRISLILEANEMHAFQRHL